MRRNTVRAASQGAAGQAKELSEIDDRGASWRSGRGQLRGTAGQPLVALLGSRPMESPLEWVIGQQGLGGCATSKVSRVLELTYAATFLAKEEAQ